MKRKARPDAEKRSNEGAMFYAFGVRPNNLTLNQSINYKPRKLYQCDLVDRPNRTVVNAE